MRAFFGGPEVAFLLATSPTDAALEEARYFETRTRELELPLAGTVLNRSRAWTVARPLPSEAYPDLEKTKAPGALARALVKLDPFGRAEAESARRHQALQAQLAERDAGFALALPELPEPASDLEGLAALAAVFERA